MPPSSEQGEYFSPPARAAAIGAALPLLGTYFTKKNGRLAASTAALAVGSDEVGDLVDALRLRVALAAASRLSSIVDSALARPNFKYATRRDEMSGAIRGRLDLQRLIRMNGRVDVPPRYPVRTVERSHVTPENVLLVSALLWVRRELRVPVTRRLAAENIEARQATAAGARIDRNLARTELRGCRSEALERLARGTVASLCDDVERRLAAGHVRIDAYRELVEWMRRCLAGRPAAEAGELEWSFYGSEFDTKLFEVWVLSELRIRLQARLGVVANAWDFFDEGDVVDVVLPDARRVRLAFQRSMKRFRGPSASSRWKTPAGDAIRDIPDYLLAVDGDQQSTFVLDAKLRRRKSAPTQEIYKLLGYFNHFAMDDRGQGAIIYYAPEPNDPVVHDYHSPGTGRIVAFSVDPERPDMSDDGWDSLFDLAGL